MPNNTKSLQERNSELSADLDHLIKNFLDSKSMEILYVIAELPKSASQISRETKIPINTVYNKMKKLAQKNIIKISGNINEIGRRHMQYKSKLNLVDVLIE